MKKKILVTRQYPDQGIKLLEQEDFTLTIWGKDRPMTPAELVEKSRDQNAILCTVTDQIDQAFLKTCCHLDIISQFAVGHDNIDIESATHHGIPIGYTPDAMSDATADIAFGLMIAVARKMFFMHNTIGRGQWQYFTPTKHLGRELKHKTLGIFGLGRIGVKLAQRCKGAYAMDLIYHNRARNIDAEKSLGARYVEFDDLLAQSDVLSVHCSLTPKTREVFNTAAFQKMKPTSIFINTARGPVHQEQDLILAMQTGQIWGVGLDVTNPEPMQPDNPLLTMKNACVLPHVGSATVEARNQMSVLAAQNIIEFYRTGKVVHLVNPEVLKA